MNIETPQQTMKDITYGNPSFAEFLSGLKDIRGHHLSLFLGLYGDDKRRALKEVVGSSGLEVERLDFNDLVSKIERETFENFDRLFGQHTASGTILYFANGDKLCGAYTGFTHSKVKYATPQERYFLKMARGYPGLVIVDISEYDAADGTLKRASHSIVKFPLPKSPVRRILWHLKNYSLHGFDIKTKRPGQQAV